jgi:hypothetical protein
MDRAKSETNSSRRPPKAVGVILGCAALGLLLAATFVAFHWQSITDLAQRSAKGLARLSAVQAAVAGAYATPEVVVRHNVSVGQADPVLSIQIVNSPLVPDPSSELAKLEAVKVAGLARDVLPPDKAYASYLVIFTKQVGAGLTFSTGRSFPVAAADLPPPAVERPGRP